jgi:hypothetical protein
LADHSVEALIDEVAERAKSTIGGTSRRKLGQILVVVGLGLWWCGCAW